MTSECEESVVPLDGKHVNEIDDSNPWSYFATNSDWQLRVIKPWFTYLEWVFILGLLRYMNLKANSVFIHCLFGFSLLLVYTYSTVAVYRAYKYLVALPKLKHFAYTPTPHSKQVNASFFIHFFSSAIASLILLLFLFDAMFSFAAVQNASPDTIKDAPQVIAVSSPATKNELPNKATVTEQQTKPEPSWTAFAPTIANVVCTLIIAIVTWASIRHQFRAAVHSKSRQEWIDSLRSILAEFRATIYDIQADITSAAAGIVLRPNTEGLKDVRHVNLLKMKAQLFLNPKEDDHSQLITIMDELQNLATIADTIDSANRLAQLDTKFIELAQSIFKQEWEKVKQGM